MEHQLINIKKYPKSATGLQCIGPCYPKNKTSIHPIRMDIVSSNQYSYCAVNQFNKYNPEKQRTEEVIIDKCYNNNNSQNKVDSNENILNVIVPFMDFNLHQFLIIFYNIHTYEDGIEYISKNKSLSLSTLQRIYEAMLNVYASKIDIIDNRTIDFVIILIKKEYTGIFYERLKKYIYVDKSNEEVYLKKNGQSDDNDNIVLKTNYIIKSFINPNDVSKFLFKYFKSRKNDFEDSENIIKNLMDDFCSYIINIIISSIDK
jgi:hypothetical protein